MNEYKNTAATLAETTGLMYSVARLVLGTNNFGEFKYDDKVYRRINAIFNSLSAQIDEMSDVYWALSYQEDSTVLHDKEKAKRIQEARYQLGLMSKEEEMVYIFPKPEEINEMPF